MVEHLACNLLRLVPLFYLVPEALIDLNLTYIKEIFQLILQFDV
jgi:hypothetical protein